MSVIKKMNKSKKAEILSSYQDILIFDEPTRGLDDYSIEVFIKKMKDLIEKGKTIIIASHDFVDIGYSRFITMKSGKLYEETAE